MADKKVPPRESKVRRLEFALVRAISALEMQEYTGSQVISYKKLIKDLKRELNEIVEEEQDVAGSFGREE